MNNNELVKQASQFGNVLAYDPSKPPPAGFVVRDDLSVDSSTGLKLTTFYNAQTKQIAVAVAGTNDLKDVAGYPSLYLGYGSNKAQIDEATKLFDEIRAFAKAETANVLVSGHSFGGLFVDIGASTYGFQGVKFDGVGGKSVLNDTAYQAQLQSLGITPSSGGNVVSVGVNGFFNQVFGGGLVEYFGRDVSNTTYCTVNTDRGMGSGVLNLLGTLALGLPGYLTIRLASAGYDHNSDSINTAMQSDKFTCNWITPPETVSIQAPTISMDDVLNVYPFNLKRSIGMFGNYR